jgi:transposase-like protein
MENRLAKKEAIDQVPIAVEPEDTVNSFESLGDFLDHGELGVRGFVRVMLQEYAKDEFMRYIGAKPYERNPNRRDYRHGSRKKVLETRFGVIEDLELPLGRKAGISYSTILPRYRRQDGRIEEIVSEMFLRGVSTRKVGKISRVYA